ncbi:hypothetical protein SAMN05216205_1225 [Pseudomonas mohnii]|uniref:Uncharacterized protein n=1 Tax=Pseudomonas mohnii TaxID=395600 RepID=A0ABY0XRU8_9PSED|nr:hypothetical protein [Pseudomonas mohnii]SEC01030.1 hypothetical protein SAMN05216205_1225 [Pseudomonas mohnii]
MPLNNPKQELKRDLKDAAAALEHADTLALMMLISGLYAGDRLSALADEVMAGRIVRGKAG